MNSPLQPWKIVSSSIEVGMLTEGWNLADPAAANDDGVRVFRFNVYFATPFEAPPVLHLGLTGFDLDQRDSERLKLRAAELTATGFVAEISTWWETRVYSVEFSWLAVGA